MARLAQSLTERASHVRASAERVMLSLEAREAARLGGVARQSALWAFRVPTYLGVRLYFRYFLLTADTTDAGKRMVTIGAVTDLLAAYLLASNHYPYRIRLSIEVLEAALLAPTVTEYSSAAQLTAPSLMELTYRGGPRYALGLSLAQFAATSAVRRVAGQPFRPLPFGYHAIAVVAVEQLGRLEHERNRMRVTFADDRRRAVVASGYLAGRYDAAAGVLSVAGPDKLIPHDQLGPLASIFQGTGIIERSELVDSPLGRIGPRQQKAYLRGLSVSLGDAIALWRTSTNRKRPRIDDQLLAGEPLIPPKGYAWLLTPTQTEELFKELDALELPGGRLQVSKVEARQYAGAVSLEINGSAVHLATDRNVVPLFAANILLAAPAGATLWALADGLPGSSNVPPWVAVLAAFPAGLWWQSVEHSRPSAEQPQLGTGLGVAAAHAGVISAYVRASGHSHPDGVSPWSQALLAPAAMLGACWTRLSRRARFATIGSLGIIAVVAERSIPAGGRRRAGGQIAGSILCFIVGTAFDRARMQALRGQSAEVEADVERLRDYAFWMGRAEELELCLAACDQAETLARRLSPRDRDDVETRIERLRNPLEDALRKARGRWRDDVSVSETDTILRLRQLIDSQDETERL